MLETETNNIIGGSNMTAVVKEVFEIRYAGIRNSHVSVFIFEKEEIFVCVTEGIVRWNQGVSKKTDALIKKALNKGKDILDKVGTNGLMAAEGENCITIKRPLGRAELIILLGKQGFVFKRRINMKRRLYENNSGF